jgi:hypothetical protein
METSTSFQSSWTLAEALIFDIAAHIRNGRGAWLNGNLEKYYWEFESIIRGLKGMLDDKEKEEAKKQEIEIMKSLPITSPEKKKALCILLKDYDELVMTCLHKHKLDVPPKKDYTNLGG